MLLAKTTPYNRRFYLFFIGCHKTKTIIFYNPLTKSYYRPPAFCLDEGRLPATNFPSLKYDGGLTCGSYRDRTDPVPEPFPPGTRVSIERDGMPTRRGTVQIVPAIWSSTISSSANNDEGAPDDEARYTILIDDGTQENVPFIDLAKPASTTASPSPPGNDPFSSLPHFLQRGSKITLDHEGQFVKGFLSHHEKEGFTFDVRRNSRSAKVDWQVTLTDLPRTWSTLVGEDLLLPGHSTVSSFLRPSTKNNAPSANFVSAKNLLGPCPASLLQALHPSNPDRDIWLRSYNEEKGGLEAVDVYERIKKRRICTYVARSSSPRPSLQCASS